MWGTWFGSRSHWKWKLWSYSEITLFQSWYIILHALGFDWFFLETHFIPLMNYQSFLIIIDFSLSCLDKINWGLFLNFRLNITLSDPFWVYIEVEFDRYIIINLSFLNSNFKVVPLFLLWVIHESFTWMIFACGVWFI